MGIVSKLHASPLVSLCKERKEIIKATLYCRYDLVTTFVVYLESLLELGNTLNQYVEQELVIFDDCCAHLEFSSSDSDSDLDSSLHHFHSEDEESRGLLDDMEVHDESNTCKCHAEVYNMDRNNMKTKGKPRVETTCHESSNFSSNNFRHSNHENTHIHVAMSHEDLGQHKHSHMMEMETPQSGHWFPQHVNQDSFGPPMSFNNYNDRFVHYGTEAFPMTVSPNYDAESQKHGTEQNNPATVSPSPPPPQVSTWDFLYPFSMNYDVPYDHDHDVREVREREGIPDLEDGSEQSSTVSVFDQKEMGSGMRHGSGNGTSNVTQLNVNEDASSTNPKELIVWGGTTEEKTKYKTTVEGSESLGTSSVTTTPVASCRMSLKEAVLDIRNDFKYLFDCGKEFSSVIEVGKRPHHSVSNKLRAFASSVLRLIRIKTSLCHSYMFYQPAHGVRLLSNVDMQNNQEHVCTTFGDLSSTLEKLYVWEKKLYGEVMGEEKLRIPYDKQYKRLKTLDDKGAESDKIDDTLASINLLHSEISVAVASISVISREINKLRDNKLLPELNKLIKGLIRLWKIMSVCHQKQFQAIRNAKSHIHILDPGNRKKSSSKATLRLERVILNWGACFSKFINTQKALVKHLNDWLLRFIHKPEETKNGIGPLLPSDIGAPPIFGVCTNWYRAIDKISEIGVSKAISDFASSLHQLYEKLEEEHALKARVKYLLKDYQHRLKSICKKNGITSKHCLSFINMNASEYFVEAEIPLLRVSDDNLATSRKRLVEQKKRHREVIRHCNDIASSCLQEGLTPIFYALGSFCLENLKIYEQLRLPNSGPMNK